LLHRIERKRTRGHLTAIPTDFPDLNYDLGLYKLRKRLKEHGKDLPDFQLPLPVQQWERLLGNPLIARELDYDHEDEQHAINELQPQLNEDQRIAFDAITSCIITNSTDCRYFIQGPAGTGKTFLYRALCHHLHAQKKIVLCVASSGIAALLLPGGTTAHSRFKIPLKISATSTCSIAATSQTAALLRQTALII
jgi:PIF1-like helicase